MNSRRELIVRPRSRSRSRSRSSTPVAASGQSVAESPDFRLSPSPPPRARNAFPAIGTPGGSSFCYEANEWRDDIDISDEEVEELMAENPQHFWIWLGGDAEEGPSKSPVAVIAGVTSDVAVSHEVDVRPSTSGATVQLGKAPSYNTGSDLDSDHDDEYEPDMPATHDMPPDEELEPEVREMLTDVWTGMDIAADSLLGTSASFEWHSDFESFRGVREEFSGPTPGPLKDYDSVYDAFIDIWDKDIIDLIVVETNRYAQQNIADMRLKGTLKPKSRLHWWTETNADEIMVLFSVFMLMAIDQRSSVNEYWTKDEVLEMPGFSTVMSYNRYVLLSKFLHFVDNKADASQQLPQTVESNSARISPKLGKMAPIIEHLGNKFQSLYNLRPEIAIDESLTLFKGSLSFVQTIRTKSARFGIKSYELCESCTGYMARFQIYTGKGEASAGDPSLGVDLGGKTTQVVLELLQGLERRGHCVVMDNYYNSPSLARYLKSLGFDCYGTLRGNRRNVPSEIAKVPKKVAKGTIIARHSGDVSIVAWMDCKMVNIISTYHGPDTFRGTKAGKPFVKPVSVRDYNKYMGGVDTKDQKLSMYLLERKRGVKWYVKMFKRLMNVSILNAMVMYTESLKRRGIKCPSHRQVRFQLAHSLHKLHRPAVVSRPVTTAAMRLRKNITHVPKYMRGSKARGRCLICQRQDKRQMVHMKCIQCDVYLCDDSCFEIWHNAADLPGREIHGRKRTHSNI